MWTGAGYRTKVLWSPPPPSSPAMPVPHRAWQSPVPYLFGGLVAILAIVAFCLLMLASSYWKLSRPLESGDRGSENPEQPTEQIMKSTTHKNQFVVIMAGDQTPTIMASRSDANEFVVEEGS